jgi:beta-lactamase class D
VFALNIDSRGADDLPLRRELVREALRAKDLLPATSEQ